MSSKLRTRLSTALKGGPGSGNHGHVGIPGHRGGSASKGNLPANLPLLQDLSGFDNELWMKAQNRILNHGIFPDHVESKMAWWRSKHSERSKVKDDICAGIEKDSNGVISYDTASALVRSWAVSSNDSSILSLTIQEAVANEFGSPLSKWQEKGLEDARRRTEYARALHLEVESARFDYHNGASSQTTLDEDSYVADRVMKKSESLGHPVTEQFCRDFAHGYTSYNRKYNEWDNMNHIGEAGIKAYVRTVYSRTQSYLASLGYKPDDEIILFRGVPAIPGIEPGKSSVASYHGNAAESWSISPRVAYDFGGPDNCILAMRVKVRNIWSTSRTGPGCLAEGEFVVLGNQNVTAQVFSLR